MCCYFNIKICKMGVNLKLYIILYYLLICYINAI